MKTKYYLSGTVLGLCMIPVVAIYLLSLKEFLRLLPDWKYMLPVAAGYAAAVLAGVCADRWVGRKGIFVTVLVLVGVFLFGVFLGCLTNLLFNGDVARPAFGLPNEIFSWFFKPAFWFTVIGAPCAVVVAVLNYLAHWSMRQWRKRNHYS